MEADYYWVPGTWVQPPQPELLWTPAYWGWDDGHISSIPVIGGAKPDSTAELTTVSVTPVKAIGRPLDHGHFIYNRSVNNVENVHITNVYNQTVVVNKQKQQCQFQLAATGALWRGLRHNRRRSPESVT